MAPWRREVQLHRGGLLPLSLLVLLWGPTPQGKESRFLASSKSDFSPVFIYKPSAALTGLIRGRWRSSSLILRRGGHGLRRRTDLHGPPSCRLLAGPPGSASGFLGFLLGTGVTLRDQMRRNSKERKVLVTAHTVVVTQRARLQS